MLQFIMAGLGAVSGVLSGLQSRNAAKAANAQVKAENRISRAEAAAQNRVRPHRNALLAAQNGLSRWAQSVNNNALLDAGAEQYEAVAVNALRTNDAFMEADFETGIRAAEEAGAQAAAAATIGVMGNVVDTINMTSSLRRSRAKQSAMTEQSMRSFDQRRQAAEIMSQTWRGLDGSVIFDNFDYGSSVARQGVGPRIPSLYEVGMAGVSGFLGAGGGSAIAGLGGGSAAQSGGYFGGLRVPAQTGASYQFNLPSSGSGLKIG